MSFVLVSACQKRNCHSAGCVSCNYRQDEKKVLNGECVFSERNSVVQRVCYGVVKSAQDEHRNVDETADFASALPCIFRKEHQKSAENA